MHLDEYRIAIRERTYVDILDLALQVIRAHIGPLSAALLVGVLPWMLFNAWLFRNSVVLDPQLRSPVDYLALMTIVVYWELPLATAPATLVLGQLLFSPLVDPKRVAGDFLRSLPQLLWYQVGLRGMFMVLIVTLIVPLAVWPYLNEVILLERNPLSGGSKAMTTQRRAGGLHNGYLADLFVRALGGAIVGAVLVAALYFTLVVMSNILFGVSELDDYRYTIFFPLALWIVVSFFSVVRFLGYLDLRIRREGWEVELLLRAEAARLTNRLT